jgi:Magnesium chelatase, subunit ChlI
LDTGEFELLRLLLDEFPEFGTRVLEVMRQPMEDKVVTFARPRKRIVDMHVGNYDSSVSYQKKVSV